MKIYVGALSPDGLVRVTPQENLCGRSLTRRGGESDSIMFCAISPDGLVRETPLEKFMWVLFHLTGL